MLSLIKNRNYLSSLKWVGLIFFTMIIAKFVLRGSQLIDSFLANVSSRTGSEVNLIIAYIILAVMPFASFIFIRLKPIYLITVIVALLPLFTRIETVFGIYAYTDFNGNPKLISGISIFAPLLLGYLLLRYPARGGWWLPSSKAFWVLACSGVMTQFFFFAPFSALRIAYLVIVVQLIWYLIIVKYVNTLEEAYKIIWGIILSGIIYVFLSVFTTGEGGKLMLQPESYGRLRAIGDIATHYGLLMAGLLSLLPILYDKSQKLGKLISLVFIPIFLWGLLLTGARAAYLSILPMFGYLFVFKSKKKQVILFLTVAFITLWVFGDKISLYLSKRPITLDDGSVQIRFLIASFTLSNLMSWPHFLIGFGSGTLENWYTIPDAPRWAIQGVHHGFLSVWVSTGFAGLLGFCFWLGYGLWGGIRKAIASHQFEERLVLLGLVISVGCWVTFFSIGEGSYTTSHPELYAILTTEVGLLVALGQKRKHFQERQTGC